jgi:dihydrofolate synthase / folylpolyglutamate synthase
MASSQRDPCRAFLASRINYEKTLSIPYQSRDFRLDRMRELLALLGNPQDRLKIIHVAGTKGKGSTSAMIAAALSAAGYRCGLYTSPHLDRLEERFMIDGQPCSASELAALVEKVRPHVDQLDTTAQNQTPSQTGPTYFEIITAMALLHFADRQTDAAVIEVGLGGRLDSTNVCDPLVSVITSISFDHTDLLGDTLTKIAREKAGIIKPQVPVVSGVLDEEPRHVIATIAHENGSHLIQLGVDFDYQYHPPRRLDNAASQSPGPIDYENRSLPGMPQFRNVELGPLGRHQAANAAVALAVLDELRGLGWQLPENDVRRGLANLKVPARIEIIARSPTVVLDTAHNIASVQSLLQTLEESFDASRRLLLFATTQGKDARGMLQHLLPHFEAVVLTQYVNNVRAVTVSDIEKIVAELSDIPRYICPDPRAAWAQIRSLATTEDLICITGSFFLAAEIRPEIAALPLGRTTKSTAHIAAH